MNKSDFYERVKGISKERNITVRSLIESCGINYDSYNSYRRYGNLPRADESVLIAKALGTSVEYLVTGQKEKQDNRKAVALLKEALTVLEN